MSDYTRKYTYVQSFLRFLKENHVWFYEKHLRCCEESSLKHSIVLPNDNFLEQEFENFNRDEVGKGEPLGDDNNGIENFKLRRFQPQSCGHKLFVRLEGKIQPAVKDTTNELR